MTCPWKAVHRPIAESVCVRTIYLSTAFIVAAPQCVASLTSKKTAESTFPDSADEMPNADLHPPNARLRVCVPLRAPLLFTLISSLVKGFIGFIHECILLIVLVRTLNYRSILTQSMPRALSVVLAGHVHT